MDRVKAQELLDDPDYLDRLTMDGYHDLLIRAGLSKTEARELTKRRSWERINAGVEI